MEIVVLGSGCMNCKKLLEIVKQADQELGLQANIIYQTDMIEIAKTGIMRTPGIMIDGVIVSSGKVPSLDQVKMLLKR